MSGRRRPPSAAARRNRVTHVRRVYGVPEEALNALERYQWVTLGGDPDEWHPGLTLCWGCARATGAAKNLAMDHNHRSGEARMLLCATCNHDVLGHFRDQPAGLMRLGLALVSPPSRAAWTALGLPEPTWWSDDREFLEWVALRLDKDV